MSEMVGDLLRVETHAHRLGRRQAYMHALRLVSENHAPEGYVVQKLRAALAELDELDRLDKARGMDDAH